MNGSVLFASDTAAILPAARQRLDDVATALKTQRNAQFVIEGYTDSRGPASMNVKLSEARAQAVRDYLVDHGVDEGRISAVGKGKENPIATNATAEGRANNRRVEIIINRREAQR
ncbi:MAG: OmpA family protein [Myxococcales bacterium]|nr:OmpA family protein [Myxococcales bacterium]